jgi:hypothetical protein
MPLQDGNRLASYSKASLEVWLENRCVFFYRGSMSYYMDLSVREAGSPGRAFS